MVLVIFRITRTDRAFGLFGLTIHKSSEGCGILLIGCLICEWDPYIIDYLRIEPYFPQKFWA